MLIVRNSTIELTRDPDGFEERAEGGFDFSPYTFQGSRIFNFDSEVTGAHASVTGFTMATANDHNVERIELTTTTALSLDIRSAEVLAMARFRDSSPEDDSYLMTVSVQVIAQRNHNARLVSSGETEIGDWRDFNGTPNGIFVDVDTSLAGFRSTPHYMVSVFGTSRHWRAIGAHAIYDATPEGFRVFLSWATAEDNPSINPLTSSVPMNERQSWTLKWTGVEM